MFCRHALQAMPAARVAAEPHQLDIALRVCATRLAGALRTLACDDACQHEVLAASGPVHDPSLILRDTDDPSTDA